MKGPESERSPRINHFTKKAVFMDFAISEASGKLLAGSYLTG